MNITVMTAKKILNAWFLEMSSRIVLHATAKKSINSCQHAVFSVREAMVKRSSPLLRNHHAVGVPPPVVRPVVNNGKNN
jgi:hypothetical protein